MPDSQTMGLVALVGAILLGAALLYARIRTRAAGGRARQRTEEATRENYRREAEAERRDGTGL